MLGHNGTNNSGSDSEDFESETEKDDASSTNYPTKKGCRKRNATILVADTEDDKNVRHKKNKKHKSKSKNMNVISFLLLRHSHVCVC